MQSGTASALGDLFHHVPDRTALLGQEAGGVEDGDLAVLACVQNAELAGERGGGLGGDAVERLVEAGTRCPQQVANRVHDFELVGEALGGDHAAQRLARKSGQLAELGVADAQKGLVARAEHREQVVVDGHDRHGRPVVGPEYVPRLADVAAHDGAGAQRLRDERLVGDADLDDSGPADAAADAADVREPARVDPAEQEHVDRARGSRHLLEGRSR